ncbi:MAG: hypothetical protein RQ746_15650 [Bacteroidales bacterium]|nr:hypothetical protein [Bacteroidales bacterium]
MRHTYPLHLHIHMNYPFDLSQLKRWRSWFDWSLLAQNTNLPWSLEFFQEFDKELTMPEIGWSGSELEELAMSGAQPGQYHLGIYNNESIPWSIELIDFIKDKATWFMLSYHWPLEESEEMLDRYADYHDFFFISRNWGLTWSPALLMRHADRWDYGYLTPRITWDAKVDREVLETLGRLDPEGFPSAMKTSPAHRLRDPLIIENSLKKHERKCEIRQAEKLEGDDLLYALENFSTHDLASMDNLPWTVDLVDYLSDREDWHDLFSRRNLPVNEALIDKHIDRIPFDDSIKEYSCSLGLSNNETMPWSVEFLDKYRDRWNWLQLSFNEGIPRTEELLEAFADHWYWQYICCEWGDFWTLERIRKYVDRVNWTGLSLNPEIEFAPEILEEFESLWQEQFLAENEGFIAQVVKPNVNDTLVAELMERYRDLGYS